MKPAPFHYLRPGSLREATRALAAHGVEARPLAGGQSLVPLMNARRIRPGVLVDLALVPDLRGVAVSDDAIHLGAMARQSGVERDPALRAALPILARALSHVGHPQIRNRGTIGGSVAHADPAAELPALVLALQGVLETASAAGPREIAADDAFVGPFRSGLAPGELLTGIRIPRPGLGRWVFDEVARRHGDRAMAGFVAVERDAVWRLVAFGTGSTPVRLMAAEAVLANGLDEASIKAAAAAAADEIDPLDDIHANAAYRRDAIGALVTRGLGGLTR